ncbi:CDP-glycerol--glycerophosphate glycerophosphotransferase [Halomonas campisalis]|uniref:CDP-glycerol--glycerophosphate glycerophosphotransferase n=1 Tax=Billgrantia campisalis TaxID=74661 RepID=A0ABS9P627_9GAMM|nr:CDP-glycerol glycerophosphotransferase family protein [Halomonas campisalis]MCG6656707.1 CDP-glycerol--glycerophosphate glycerophosphotransferase [Halomonas campisalis]MDR5861896.1 CDP-glycerol glycerophosphotransferase family protein [Halomonas campisalis]
MTTIAAKEPQPRATRFLLYAEQNYAYGILRPLQAAIRARGGEARWFFAGPEVDPEHLEPGEVKLGDVAAVRAWRPEVVLVPGNMVPSFIPGLKVAVFHGFNVAKAGRSDDRGHFNIRGCFDLYCTHGPGDTQGFARRAAEHGHFRVVETGWPALDPLFRPEMPAGREPDLPARDGRPRILLCSTFTPRLSCAPHLLETVRRLRDTGRWQWLIQFHPKMDPAVVEAYRSLEDDSLSFIETRNILPLLRTSDVMVCDTSSVMLMFLLQHKPVVTFRNQSRGDRSHLLDVTRPEALEGAIEEALSQPAELMGRIGALAGELHPYTDGRSSERVLDAADACLRQGRAGLKAKPRNGLRNLKERRKLGYWKPG